MLGSLLVTALAAVTMAAAASQVTAEGVGGDPQLYMKVVRSSVDNSTDQMAFLVSGGPGKMPLEEESLSEDDLELKNHQKRNIRQEQSKSRNFSLVFCKNGLFEMN